jgi:hypothetical protein
MPAVKSATRKAEQAAKDGAAAGAKMRDRELDEAASQHEAIRLAEVTGRAATWTRSYRVGSEQRTITMRETARREADAATLLRLTGEAVRLAAGRLRGRHGIPELSFDEQADLRSTLVTKLLADAGPGRLPDRAKLTRAYLVKRAEGLVLNDPDRQHTDASEDGMSPEDIAAAAEGKARDRHDRHDPMLNRGVDGTWPEIEAGCAALAEQGEPLSEKAVRCAAYLVAGGSVRDDWSIAWGTSEGYAATRLVPEGAARLRDALAALDQSPLYLAIQEAGTKDRDALDHQEAARRWLASGMTEAPRKPRAVIERRWRTELPEELHAPVVTRTDKRLIRSSSRVAHCRSRSGRLDRSTEVARVGPGLS